MGYGYEEYSEMGFDDLSNDYDDYDDYEYYIDYDDYDDYIDYDELSWDDYDTSLIARIKRLFNSVKYWIRKKTGQYDEIPF